MNRRLILLEVIGADHTNRRQPTYPPARLERPRFRSVFRTAARPFCTRYRVCSDRHLRAKPAQIQTIVATLDASLAMELPFQPSRTPLAPQESAETATPTAANPEPPVSAPASAEAYCGRGNPSRYRRDRGCRGRLSWGHRRAVRRRTTRGRYTQGPRPRGARPRAGPYGRPAPIPRAAPPTSTSAAPITDNTPSAARSRSTPQKYPTTPKPPSARPRPSAAPL